MSGSRLAGVGRAWSGEIWLLFQATAAATVAWAIASQIGDHSNPFCAPIAAVVALSFARGERGLNALWLLAGVGIGITTGEFMVVLFGGDYWSMALAIFIAVLLARALGPCPSSLECSSCRPCRSSTPGMCWATPIAPSS
jgi:hypothetical protein